MAPPVGYEHWQGSLTQLGQMKHWQGLFPQRGHLCSPLLHLHGRFLQWHGLRVAVAVLVVVVTEMIVVV